MVKYLFILTTRNLLILEYLLIRGKLNEEKIDWIAQICLSIIMCRSLKTFQHIDHLQTLVITYIFTILCKLTWNNVIFVMRWWLKWFIMWVPFAKYLQSYFCVNGIILRTWESSKIFSWWANRILWNHTLWSDIFIWL